MVASTQRRSGALRRKLDWNSNGMYTAWLQGTSRACIIKILQRGRWGVVVERSGLDAELERRTLGGGGGVLIIKSTRYL
jgi:hypothetical protein